jgi:hypothetical protein
MSLIPFAGAVQKFNRPRDTGYRIERSLRFNSADSAYLNRTPAGAGNRTTWTWSGWVKRAALGTSQYILQARISDTGNDTDKLTFRFTVSNTLTVQSQVTIFRETTAVYRDASAWYHIVLTADTSNATANNRFRIYVNGVEQVFSTTNNPTSGLTTAVNSANEHWIGSEQGVSSYLSAYLTEIHFIDGQALTPTSFGEFNSDTGVWQPKAYTGSYGTNGFYLDFADNSGTTSTTLGKDSSGNGNNWTPNNFSVTAGAGNDSLVDSPTRYGTDTGAGGEVRGNYATLNPLDIGSSVSTFSNGNLDVVTPSSGGGTCRSTLGVSSGKWYWEVTPTSNATALQIGIVSSTAKLEAYLESCETALYFISGNKGTGPTGSNTSYGSTITDNDVVGVALDLDSGTLAFYKNGVSMGTAFSSISGTYSAGLGDSSNSISVTANANFGQRPFAFSAPSGFKALVTTNLP